MTRSKRIAMLLLAALACLVAAGCGGDDEKGRPIPSAQAQALDQQLDRVQARLDNGSYGACKDVFESADSANEPAVRTILAQIPNSVDADVRSALQDSFDRLWELVHQECDDRKPEEQPNTESEPEATPETTPTTPTTPTTTPTTPTTTPTDPEEAPQPEDGDGNGGTAVPGNNGNGNGNGNGGGASP